MKKFLIILLLFLVHQTSSLANTLTDFQISKYSVGQSLTNFYSENYIKKNIIFYSQAKGDKRYAKIEESGKIYDKIVITFQNNKTYKIAAVEGFIFFKNRIKDCLKERDKAIKDISNMFKEEEQYDFGKKAHWADQNSYTYDFVIGFGSREELSSTVYDNIRVSCYDWSKKLPYDDHFRITISLKEISTWLNNLN